MADGKSCLLPDEERYSLIAGPYVAPDVRPGDWLMDEERGMVEVGGYTQKARIPWPRIKKTGRASLILCGDLVRAVRTESALAIKYWWNVGDPVVARWRKLLGVGQTTGAGTRRLYQLYKPRKLPNDVVERGREKAMSAESRAQAAATKRGRPAHPNTRAALLEAAKRPKSAEHREKMRENMRRAWEDGTRNRTPVWTRKADAELIRLLLKGLTCREIAEIMGKTRQSILSNIRELRNNTHDKT